MDGGWVFVVDDTSGVIVTKAKESVTYPLLPTSEEFGGNSSNTQYYDLLYFLSYVPIL